MFSVVLLAFIGVILNGKCKDPTFMNREQTEEWKGTYYFYLFMTQNEAGE